MRLNLATILAMAVGTNAALTSTQVVDNIKELTQESTKLNDVTKSLTSANVFDKGPLLVDQLKDTISTILEHTGELQDAKPAKRKRSVANKRQADEEENGPEMSRHAGKKRQNAGYPDAEQLDICDAFRILVKAYQPLLSTVIGKHGLLSQAQFAKPIAAVLEQLEAGVDVLAFSVIDLAPICAKDATADKKKLDDTIIRAEEIYAN